jgi:predicted Zn-dependent peptidase
MSGALDNGMRFAVMANQQPKDKVTLRLQVQCGSLQESAPQRGLAHFLEHLAFNGTTHYPPGTLVERLQHLGLAFGAHTNAHTSFDVYSWGFEKNLKKFRPMSTYDNLARRKCKKTGLIAFRKVVSFSSVNRSFSVR